jgi:hypothetical protein
VAFTISRGRVIGGSGGGGGSSSSSSSSSRSRNGGMGMRLMKMVNIIGTSIGAKEGAFVIMMMSMSDTR